jgi:Calcineurin-like phosphoesterase
LISPAIGAQIVIVKLFVRILPLRVLAALACAIVFASLASDRAPSAQSNDLPCDIRTTERIVAIGDIHGAYDRFVAILRAANLLDTRDRWIGQKTVLIQTGDIVDRGPDSKKAIDLIRKLERDAPRAGGRVYALLGNHELARLIDDWRYVSAGEFDAFKTGDSTDLRDRAIAVLGAEAEKQAKAAGKTWNADEYREKFIKDIPLGYLEMRQAFGPMGDYGKWVRARPTVARVNGILFMHGGISPMVAPMGCEGINLAVRKDLASLPLPLEQAAMLFSSSETGPLWYRGLASDPEAKIGPELDATLMQLRARAIVFGHTTTPGRIVTRLGGRIIQIDSGMVAGQFYPGGAPSALELIGDKATAIYLDRREPLEVPALSAAPAAASR